MNNFHDRPTDLATNFLSIGVTFLCQLLLTFRSYLFAAALRRPQRLSPQRYAISALQLILVFTSFICAVVENIDLWVSTSCR